jgi:hypothetical protein
MKEIPEEIDRDMLLNEIYVFVAMKHRACDPWREALNSWQDRVESLTGWDAYEEIETYKRLNSLNTNL